MITGAHAIIYSSDPEADRAFFRDVLNFPHVDAGGEWLIFKLPASELAVHPSDNDGVHELYLVCDDITVFVDSMTRQNASCSDVSDEDWGLLSRMTLPGGGTIGVYEPRHARPG